jgi:hypothetical protein
MMLAWKTGSDQFKPRLVGDRELVTLFMVTYRDKRLSLAVNSFADFDKFNRSIPRGEYQLTVALQAGDIETVTQVVDVLWDGSGPDGLTIKLARQQ